VSSHEQIRRCLVRSAITLTVSCNLSCLPAAGGNWPELPGKYILIALKSPMSDPIAGGPG
jgi:hypothetical protein